MRLYGPEELKRFLRGIDKALDTPQTVIVIRFASGATS
jgi:hypothetical protein